MRPGPDESAAAGLAPFAGHRRAGTFQAFLAFGIKDAAFFLAQDLGGFGHSRSIDEVFRIHEFSLGVSHDFFEPVKVFQQTGIHIRLGHMQTDRFRITGAAEISGQRLFADHMFPRIQSIDDHFFMDIRRSADVDDIDLVSFEQILEPQGVIHETVAVLHHIHLLETACGNGMETDRNTGETVQGIQMQFCSPAGSGSSKADFFFTVHSYKILLRW